MQDNGILQRLQILLEHFGLNQSQFANKLGVAQSNMNALFNGKRPLGKNMANSIALTFGISPQWLLQGEGEMIYSNDMSAILKDQKKVSKKPTVIEACNVPLVHIDSVGGIHSDNAIYTPEYTERLIPIAGAREGDIAIYQSGDSMTPGIPSGSILLIREVLYWREYIGYGDVFVLQLEDDRRITKELHRFDADPENYLWCVSYNPNVEDEPLPKKIVKRVWRVVKILINKD